MRSALTKEEVRKVITRSGCSRVPIIMAKWWGEGLEEMHGSRLQEIASAYPEDVCMLWLDGPGYETSPNSNPHYRFGFKDYTNSETHSIGQSVVLLEDWSELDAFLSDFPDPNEPGSFREIEKQLKHANGRYTIGAFWRLYHERLWSIRGMENLMMDYYDNMEGLKALCRKLTDFYKVIIDRFAALGCDAIFTSDDLGHQQGPMMSPAIFHELYYPFYCEIAEYIHHKGMHFLLHSCGDNSLLLEDLAEAGLDVFHPIQKGCMDMEKTAADFGNKLSFLVGMDVQHLLVEGTPEEVRAEIRQMKRIFQKPEGGLLLAMGNGIMPGTPLENIRAALDEMYSEN